MIKASWNESDIITLVFTYNQHIMQQQLAWLFWLILPGYWLISLFFLCFPNILHKKNRYAYEPFNQLIDSDKIYVIGHRGGGFEGPQNTLELFKFNAAHSHMIELDICITKDGQLVVHHDAHLQRTCGVTQQINQLYYKELPCLLPQFESFGGGGVIKTVRNKIPLLQQLFAQFPDTPMNIDLKTPTPQAMTEFDRLVRKHSREDITVWGSFNAQANLKLRQINPEVVYFYSTGQVFKIFLLTLFGLLPFVCLEQGVLDLPLITSDFQRMAYGWYKGDSACRKCLICLVLQILKIFDLMGRLFVPHLKKRGILSFYWTVNEEDDFASAISHGCSGIMTDRTKRLSQYLKNNRINFQKQNDSF